MLFDREELTRELEIIRKNCEFESVASRVLCIRRTLKVHRKKPEDISTTKKELCYFVKKGHQSEATIKLNWVKQNPTSSKAVVWLGEAEISLRDSGIIKGDIAKLIDPSLDLIADAVAKYELEHTTLCVSNREGSEMPKPQLQ